jgi:hypothetical protein
MRGISASRKIPLNPPLPESIAKTHNMWGFLRPAESPKTLLVASPAQNAEMAELKVEKTAAFVIIEVISI